MCMYSTRLFWLSVHLLNAQNDSSFLQRHYYYCYYYYYKSLSVIMFVYLLTHAILHVLTNERTMRLPSCCTVDDIFTGIYFGGVACCPLVSHVAYASGALLRLEKYAECSVEFGKKTGQTDGWTYVRQTVTLRLPLYAASEKVVRWKN